MWKPYDILQAHATRLLPIFSVYELCILLVQYSQQTYKG
jgi:hypothetical protein